MTPYQPFLIAPFGTGLDTDKAPWLLPQDAFSNIVNGHIHHGVVEKRQGYTKQADLVHQDQTNWKISNVSVGATATVTVVGTTGLTNGDTVEIRNVLGMTQLNGNQYIVANLAGTTFDLSGVDSTGFTAYGSVGDVMLIPGDRVMGLERYITATNVKEVIAFDQTRACKFNPTTVQYDPLDSADIMNAGTANTDYIWAANWASTASSAEQTLYRMYFTNGRGVSGSLNGIRFYAGGTETTEFRPVINAHLGGTIINGCKLLFPYRERLVLLHTIEGANTYPQRVRWSQIQNPAGATAWDDAIPGRGGFNDCPTGDQIISAQFVQDILVVFFTDSVWTLRPQPNPAKPFRWDKVNDIRSCDGKMTTEQFDRYVLSMGIRGITATSGIETQRVDERIEDFVTDEINDAQFDKVFAKRSYAHRRLWMLYPKDSSTEANAALIYDEESSAYSKYSIALNVLGYGGAELDSAIDNFGDKTINDFNETLKDFFYDKGSEIFLGGNRSGEVFKLEQAGGDEEDNFSATIIDVTQANPGVVTMTADVGISDGDIITISDIAVGSMVELNDRQFTVASKSGNTFALSGEETSGFAAYVAASGGTVGNEPSTSISFELLTAAWNPWMTEGKQAQLGYVDLFVESHPCTKLTAQFFKDNDFDFYKESTINLLPNLVERGSVTGVTQANPGQVTSEGHGLSDNDTVFMYGVEGMDQANGGPYTVTVVDGNNFTIGVDTSNFGVYTNFGVVTELPYQSSKAWKRIYAGGTGYQHKIKFTSAGANRPLCINAFIPWFKPRAVRPI